MRTITILLTAAVLTLAGCGDGDDTGATASTVPATETKPGGAGAAGTRISVHGSDYGRMLWGPDRQAIYIFERDEANRSRCYGECARAWPPVFTGGKPVAGRGVRRSLLGTTRRRGGRRQVTYAGKPLYYYVNEGPREVRCHNVFLNGGYWWVIGPGGKRRP